MLEKEKKEVVTMDVNLREYLTGEERRQMDALIMIATARRELRGDRGCSGQFFMAGCQCGCGHDAKKQHGEDDGLPTDMAKLFGEICDFCQKYGMCPIDCGDEELPFPV